MVKITYTSDSTKKTLLDAFYQRLIDAYGYVPEQLGRDVCIGNTAKADIAIWRSSDAKNRQSIPDICVVVLCREEHIKIDANKYMASFKEEAVGTVNFFVLHNLKETKVFYMDDSHGGAVEQFCDFPKASDIAADSKMTVFVDRMRQNSKENLITAFGKSHNIIRNNDKLSPEAAFDEISKVIFIKMLYEREPNNELVFTRDKFLRDEHSWQKNHKGDYIVALFEGVKQQYLDDGLFEPNEILRIRRESFLQILDEFCNISLYGVAEDVKGVAFESFLGKTFRGELGQFFTPRTIVNFMVDVLNIKEGELLCDPCCGSGGFLIRAFEKVQDDIDNDIHQQLQTLIINSSAKNMVAVKTLMGELNKDQQGSRYYKLCHDYFYGVDANVRMARTSKMNMIMHGDGHVGVYLHDGLLNVGGIKENMFDVVLINPPFGVHVDRSMKVTNAGQTMNNLYEMNSSNAEILFIERTIKLLKPGGRAALVLPEGVFNNSTNKKVRKYVEERAHILGIVSIPADVFLSSGANIKPSILIIKKLEPKDRKDYKQINKEICACKVNDAGINSLGMPSDNRQLTELVPVLRRWIENGVRPEDSERVKMLDYGEMEDWNVQPFFEFKQQKFRPDIPVVKLGDILRQAYDIILLKNDVLYTRITVKLFNKGIVERDRVYGSEIGTKKQFQVHNGQFVISKIDGKSGAFGFIPDELDGSIVTQDFPVFEIDSNRVLPEYLELILASPSILDNVRATSSGSTGRKRLSVSKFLATRIPLPSLVDQQKYLDKIISLRLQQRELEKAIDNEVVRFNETIFES